MDKIVKERFPPEKVKELEKYIRSCSFECKKCIQYRTQYKAVYGSKRSSDTKHMSSHKRRITRIVDTAEFFMEHYGYKYILDNDIKYIYTVTGTRRVYHYDDRRSKCKYFKGDNLIGHLMLRIMMKDLFIRGIKDNEMYIYDCTVGHWRKTNHNEGISFITQVASYIGFDLHVNIYSINMVFSCISLRDLLCGDNFIGIKKVRSFVPCDSQEHGMLFMRELFVGNEYSYYQFRWLLYTLLFNEMSNISNSFIIVDPPDFIIWLMRSLVTFDLSCIVKSTSIKYKSANIIMNTNNTKEGYFIHQRTHQYPDYTKSYLAIITDCRTMKHIMIDTVKFTKYHVLESIYIISNAQYKTLENYKYTHFGNCNHIGIHPNYIKFTQIPKSDVHIDEKLLSSIAMWASNFYEELPTSADMSIDSTVLKIFRYNTVYRDETSNKELPVDNPIPHLIERYQDLYDLIKKDRKVKYPIVDLDAGII